MKAKWDFNDKDTLALIEEMAREGQKDKEIARALGYNDKVFCTLKRKHSNLYEALKRGRRPLSFYVESSLFKRAVGLKTKTVTTKQIKDKATGVVIAEEITTTETELPPETAAMAFWLKQRKPEMWNKPSKTDITTNGKEFSTPPLVFLDVDKLSDQQLEQYYNLAKQKDVSDDKGV